MQNQYKKGFTLLEILLVIAAIGILAAIVIVALNPTRQLSQARNADRRADINTLYKAVEQYNIDNRGYPPGITNTAQSICPSGGGCVDLSMLVPNYLASIPTDPTGTSYTIRVNPDNNRLSVAAPVSELGQVIVVNPRVLPWAEGGDNVYTISVSGVSYRVHEFTNPGSSTLTFTRGGNVEYVIVGGGGGSGTESGIYPYAGGGGAVVTGSTVVNPQAYSVIVGAGGLYRDTNIAGDNGLPSSIFSITANPGLGGRSSGTTGGSSGAGFVGGNRQGCGTGGGGGAGGIGGNALPSCGNNGTGGAGGIGIQSNITGTFLGYGGGGAGVSWNQGSGTSVDGGGRVGLGVNHVAIPATSPTRGGGGGSWQNGGNGTVIVRYIFE